MKKEILKWLQADFIYAISDSTWVSSVHVIPKKSGIIVVKNEKGEEMPTRIVSGHRVCIDYRKLNLATDVSFSCVVKHKDDGQTKFIKPNSQRQDIIIKY